MTVSFKVSAVEGALLHPKSPIESWFTRLTFKADSQAGKNNFKKIRKSLCAYFMSCLSLNTDDILNKCIVMYSTETQQYYAHTVISRNRVLFFLLSYAKISNFNLVLNINCRDNNIAV